MLADIITTVIGFTVSGLVLMVIGFFTVRYFVRMIMKEIFNILKERVIEGSVDTSKKKRK